MFRWVDPPFEVCDVIFLQHDDVDVLLIILGLFRERLGDCFSANHITATNLCEARRGISSEVLNADFRF